MFSVCRSKDSPLCRTILTRYGHFSNLDAFGFGLEDLTVDCAVYQALFAVVCGTFNNLFWPHNTQILFYLQLVQWTVCFVWN